MIRKYFNKKDSAVQTGDSLVDNILDEYGVKYFGDEPKDEVDQKEFYGYITKLEGELVEGIVDCDNEQRKLKENIATLSDNLFKKGN